ncbi:MAG: Gfo/Idh/MocA family oxidoreductase [Cyanobacteria bacterium P01_D01_bin.1]
MVNRLARSGSVTGDIAGNMTNGMTGIGVGLIGTGYAANARAKALLADGRSHLVSISSGSTSSRGVERAAKLAEQYGAQVVTYWQQLINDRAVELVVICTVSALHGEIVEAALKSEKHVVVEYPLSLQVAQAEQLVKLAADKQLLLHVEHIELLGGLHLAMRSHLPKVGKPSYVAYRTINPQSPAPKKWTYQTELFGFPFCGALSRVHRLTNLFGKVRQVNCQTRMLADADGVHFRQILSSGRLLFESGLIAEVVYGKGERLCVYHREIEVQGDEGTLFFDRNEGTLTTATETSVIAVEPRRGLFVKDTKEVLDHLIDGNTLYVSAAESLYALRVGDALQQASINGGTVNVV